MCTYKGQEVQGDLNVGFFALIDHQNLNNGQSDDFYTLEEDYGHKNMSREVCFRGWLGSYNGHSTTACGCVEVYQHGKGLRIRKAPDDVLVVALDG